MTALTAIGGILVNVLTWMLKTFGIAGCALALTLFFFMGVPFADKLKFPASYWLIGGIGIADIPIIGPLTTGYVNSYAASQVKGAQAGFEAKLATQKALYEDQMKQMVSSAELSAAKAMSFELRRQLNAASQALTENEKRQAADELAAQAQDAQSAIEVADYEKKLAAANRKCDLDSLDVDFVHAH